MTTGNTSLLPESPAMEPCGDWASYWRILRQRWRLVGRTILAFVIFAFLYLAITSPMHQAQARVLILQQGGRPLTVAGADPTHPLEGADDFIQTHAAILRSPVVIKRAIDTVGLDRLPTLQTEARNGGDPVREAIDHYLSVTRPERLARVLKIDFKARSSDEAVVMVTALIDSYRKFLEENYQQKSEVFALINRAQRELSSELETMEKQYLELRQKNPGLITDEKGRSFLTNRLERWDRAINEALVKEAQLKAQLAMGQKLSKEGAGMWAIVHAMNQLSPDPSNAMLLSFSTTISQNLAADYVRQLVQEQQQLAERYGPQYAKVQELQQQIQRIQERTRQSRVQFEQIEVSELLTAVELSLKASETMRAEMSRQLDKSRLVEADLLLETNLRNNLERRRLLYNTVVDQLKQAQFSGDFAAVSSQVIEPANVPPSSPMHRWAGVLVLALLAGCVVGVGAALAADWLKMLPALAAEPVPLPPALESRGLPPSSEVAGCQSGNPSMNGRMS